MSAAGSWLTEGRLSYLRRVAAGELSTVEVAETFSTTRERVHGAMYRARRRGLLDGSHPYRADVDRLPVAPFRRGAEEAVDSGLFTWSELAHNMGYHRQNGRPGGDTTRLRRRLGILPYSQSRRAGRKAPTYFAQTIHYDVACLLVEALGVDPVDFGV